MRRPALGALYVNHAQLRVLCISLSIKNVHTHVCVIFAASAQRGPPPQSRAAPGGAHHPAAGARRPRPGAIGGAAPTAPAPARHRRPRPRPRPPPRRRRRGAARVSGTPSLRTRRPGGHGGRGARSGGGAGRAGPGAAKRGSAERPCAGAAAGPPCALPRAGLAILRRSGGTRLGSPPVMSPGQRGKATHSRAAAEA